MSSIKLMSFEEELQKNPELKEADIQTLREWCEKQPHLPKISDSELALFLHSNYYRLEPTKNTIDTFFTVRSHVPEFFCNRDPVKNKELQKACQTVTNQILEGTTREGYKIIYGRLLDSEPSHFVYNDCMKLLNMVIDLWLYTEDGLPVRLKGFHFMNASPVLDVILNMMRPFMKKQLLDMLHMHSTSDSLEKFVPLEVLPNEADGQAGPLQELHNKQVKKLEDSVAWFEDDEANHRVNESLRPGKAKTATDLFGVEGSFKKLEID
ncbi:alpha-tocopherol transfer protein-like isoform X2 [Ooceraea biroi]|uniref:alpha-tocopherol transfer protein-like isoform X2 n=1 Tax=Ooceraea biroi TaxID=2015173 RepID=UPI000F08542F|nr:alpha-tocopherol transfer protein-like isoform X2 [Ooceraea biroi]